MSAPNDSLESLASRIVQETVETWKGHMRKGWEALVRSHRASFSVFAQMQVRLQDQPVAEYLIDLLDDDEKRVRYAAIEALGEVCSSDPAARNALLDQLEGEDPDMRQQVARVLGERGISDPAILESLSDRVHDFHREVRVTSVRALGKIGSSNSKVLESHLKRLHETRTSLPFAATPRPSEVTAWAIRQIGVTEPLVTETLLNQLRENPQEMSPSAMKTLGWAGGSNPEVIEELLDLLDHEAIAEGVLPSTVAEAIGEAIDSNLAVVESLIEQLEDQNWRNRGYAAMALGEIGASNANVLRNLRNQLAYDDQFTEDDEVGEEEKAWICIQTIEALGKIGCPKPEVVRDLMHFLNLQGDGLRKKATEALGKIGASNPQVVRDFALEEHILERLNDRYFLVREVAAEALTEIGSSAQTVVDGLVNRLEVEKSIAFVDIAEALGSIGADGPRAREVLVERLDDQESTIRRASARTLGKIGAADQRAVEALVDRLDDPEWLVRYAAAEALGEIGVSDSPVIKSLANLMNDGGPHVDEAAAEALGKIGVVDLAGLKALAHHLFSEDKSTSRRAGRAIPQLPWHVFSMGQIVEEIQAIPVEDRQGSAEARGAFRIEEREVLFTHWKKLARLPG